MLGGQVVEQSAATVADLDDRYRAATIPAGDADTEDGGWWWNRVPAEPDYSRTRAEENVDVAFDYGEAHADEYGGFYLPDDAPVRCVVFFTGRVDHHTAQLRRLVPYPDGLEVRAVRFTKAELDSVKEEVRHILADTCAGCVGSRAGSDGLVVEVELPSDGADLADDLRRRFGERISVKLSP